MQLTSTQLVEAVRAQLNSLGQLGNANGRGPGDRGQNQSRGKGRGRAKGKGPSGKDQQKPKPAPNPSKYTEEEREILQERREEGSCLNCGQMGHRVAECRVRGIVKKEGA